MNIKIQSHKTQVTKYFTQRNRRKNKIYKKLCNYWIYIISPQKKSKIKYKIKIIKIYLKNIIISKLYISP